MLKIAYGKRWAINSMKRKFVHRSEIKERNEEKKKLVNRIHSLVYSNDMQDTVVNVRNKIHVAGLTHTRTHTHTNR